MKACLVTKRDGQSVPFLSDKIFYAIRRAFEDVYPKENHDEEVVVLTAEIEEEIDEAELEVLTVEDIQEFVVHSLLDSPYKEVALSYVNYKTKKSLERMQSSDVERQLRKLVERDESIIHENANKDSRVFNTQRDLTAGIAAKVIGLKMLPPSVASAHEKGEIHFHDLDYSPYSPMSNCCLVDFEFMFENGFSIGNAEVERPRSIQTAAAQMSQIIANVASSQFGGTSADRIDELLAPYAEMNYQKHLLEANHWIDEERRAPYAKAKTMKDIQDAIQSLEYEVNTLYTSNGQTPK